MNISRNILLLLVSFIVTQPSFTDEILLTELDGETITSCTVRNHPFAWRTVSAFVEEVSDLPKKIYLTEPIRVTVNSDLPNERLHEVEGTWIEVYFYINHPTCFEPDHFKTEEMQKKSELLLKKLQKKMSSNGRNGF